MRLSAPVESRKWKVESRKVGPLEVSSIYKGIKRMPLRVLLFYFRKVESRKRKVESRKVGPLEVSSIFKSSGKQKVESRKQKVESGK